MLANGCSVIGICIYGRQKAIPGWENTLLVPSLKRGVIFRIKLDPTYSTTLDDAIPMFKSNNRYRDVIASPEGNTLYVLTDTAGNVQKMMVLSLIL